MILNKIFFLNSYERLKLKIDYGVKLLLCLYEYKHRKKLHVPHSWNEAQIKTDRCNSFLIRIDKNRISSENLTKQDFWDAPLELRC